MGLLAIPAMQVLAWAKFLLPVPALYFADYVSRVVLIAVFLALGGWRLPGPSRRLPWWQVATLAVALGLALPALVLFDLTIGLALVAVAEEVAFRKVFWAVWQELGWPGLTVVSSLAFGLLHAPQGVAAVVFTAVSGALLMMAYRISGSLWVPIGLHYWADLLAFGGLHGMP